MTTEQADAEGPHDFRLTIRPAKRHPTEATPDVRLQGWL